MHIIGITAQEVMQKNVERKVVAVFEENIVAFQVRTIFYTIHHNALATPALQQLEKFIKHKSSFAQQL
jgi:hypothetical protein